MKNYFNNSSAKMTKEQYLLMCDNMGSEPVPSEIPMEFNDFPYVIQEALQIFSILPDNWEGMSGTYMGKDYSILPFLMNEIFKVENKQQTMKFLLFIGSIVMEKHSKQQEVRQRKQKKSKGGIHVNG